MVSTAVKAKQICVNLKLHLWAAKHMTYINQADKLEDAGIGVRNHLVKVMARTVQVNHTELNDPSWNSKDLPGLSFCAQKLHEALGDCKLAESITIQ